VAARRLILAMLVLLVLSSIAAALIPVDRSKLSDSSTSTSSSPTTTPAQGALIEKEISTAAKKPPTIRMQVNDELRLTVTSPVPNMIEIPAFGELENVDPDLPAQFDLLTYEPGNFAVRLVDPPGLVAHLKVAPR
jgi:hypothetical protein